MMYKSHVVFGASFVAVAAGAMTLMGVHVIPPGNKLALPLLMAVGAGGSLLPDIDHPGSWVGRRLWPISAIISSVCGHRGITHSAVAVAACMCVLGWLWLNIAASGHAVPAFSFFAIGAGILGYASHLFADWLTAGGIPLLWPKPKKYSFWRYPTSFSRTGGGFEWLATFVMGLLGLWSAWAAVVSAPGA